MISIEPLQESNVWKKDLSLLVLKALISVEKGNRPRKVEEYYFGTTGSLQGIDRFNKMSDDQQKDEAWTMVKWMATNPSEFFGYWEHSSKGDDATKIALLLNQPIPDIKKLFVLARTSKHD